jgi:hypothetical protein
MRWHVQVRHVPDTFGVCISAGGLRSAAFGMGALRELAVAGVLDQVDYLSCVSGGVSVAASLFSHAFAHQASATEETCFSSLSNDAPTSESARNNSSSALDYIDHALEQLHRQCKRSAAGSWVFAVQIWLMMVIVTLVLPLIALAAADLAGASIADAMGDALHSLLTQALHPYHLAPLVLFFAPICTALSCFVWWLAIHHDERPPFSSRLLDVSKVGSVSVGGQVRGVCVWRLLFGWAGVAVVVATTCCFPCSPFHASLHWSLRRVAGEELDPMIAPTLRLDLFRLSRPAPIACRLLSLSMCLFVCVSVCLVFRWPACVQS